MYKLEEQIVNRGQLNKKGVKSRESVFRVGEARWGRSCPLQLCSPKPKFHLFIGNVYSQNYRPL